MKKISDMKKTKIIYLEADEEITTIADRLRESKQERIMLVVPKRANLLQGLVNLRILKKQAEGLGKSIAIVTTDRVGKNLASQVGITVYSKIEEKNAEVETTAPTQENSEEIKFKKKVTPQGAQDEEGLSVSDIRFKKKPEEIEKQNFSVMGRPTKPSLTPKEPPVKDLSKSINPKKSARKISLPPINKKFLFGFIALSVFILGIVALLILPKAVISVKPDAEKVSGDIEVKIASSTKEVNLDDKNIPGSVVEANAEETRKFPATGKKNIGEKARGTITVYNEWDSNPQPLVENTRFTSSDGKIFRTTQSINVPGTTINQGNVVAGTAQVSVTADQPGEEYNVGPGNFTIPGLPQAKQSKIYGKSQAAMAGGLSKEVIIVSSKDVEDAKNVIANDLYSKTVEELKSKSNDDNMIIEAAIKNSIKEETPSPAIDAEAGEFDMKVTVQSWSVAFKKNDLRAVVKNELGKKIDDDKEIIDDGAGSFTYSVQSTDVEGQAVSLIVHANGFASLNLDWDSVKSNLAGLSKEEVEEKIRALEGIRNVEVVFWPFWVRSVPSNTQRVEIKVILPDTSSPDQTSRQEE